MRRVSTLPTSEGGALRFTTDPSIQGDAKAGKRGPDDTGRAAFRRPSLPSRGSSSYLLTVIVTLLVVASFVTFDVSVASRSNMPSFRP
jgi:hypothetical protein